MTLSLTSRIGLVVDDYCRGVKHSAFFSASSCDTEAKGDSLHGENHDALMLRDSFSDTTKTRFVDIVSVQERHL